MILNSVVQYFPSIDYLLRVLEGAVNAVAPGGSIFVGDVRSLPLLEAFHASVHCHQAPSWAASRAELRQRVHKIYARRRGAGHRPRLLYRPEAAPAADLARWIFG